MLDRLGSELDCGDLVVYIQPYYHTLAIGYVMYATPRGARIISKNSDIELNRGSGQFMRVCKGEDYESAP